MSEEPVLNGVYRHFKGNLYKVFCVAEQTETSEPYVIYKALYGDRRLYARPLDMFMSPVDKSKYPDSGQEKRFEYLGKDKEGIGLL